MLSFRSGSWRLAGAVCIGLVAAAAAAVPADGAAGHASSNGADDLETRVAKLISQLGSEEYATREKAQAALERLGLRAFDALHEAQTNDDIEIALRARYLVRSMQVSWSRDSDPREVKRILRRYSEQDVSGRTVWLERLASLSDDSGLAALCRLARFEADELLSKRAALLIMNKYEPADEETGRDELAKTIQKAVGRSKRPAAQWLRALARTMDDPESAVDDWERLSQLEERTFAQFPEKSSPRITRDLLRWQAELLLRVGRNEQANAVIRRTIELLDGGREQLLDIVDWLIHVQAWSVLDEVAGRYPDEFSKDTLLLYRTAEAQLKQGRRAVADETAAKALALLSDSSAHHLEVAWWLQVRCLYAWAEREYRHVMQLEQLGSEHDMRARSSLSELLHELQQPLAAAEVLRPAVEAMDADPKTLKRVETRLPRSPASFRSRMHLFYSLHYAATRDRGKQTEHLEKGLECAPHDVDVLIAMHRVPQADAAWREQTLKFIEAATEYFRQRAKTLQQMADHAPDEQQRAEAKYQLATANNQLAWLVSNTVGDYDEAVRCSLKSLELFPDRAPYLDTLGRCYYAKGDYVNAVRHQQRAAELEPHTLPIQRQLELFKKALSQSQKKASAAKPGQGESDETSKDARRDRLSDMILSC
jgi:tetratricopeptide (TPR) repeat protein